MQVLGSIAQDARYGARMLRKSPHFSLTAIGILANRGVVVHRPGEACGRGRSCPRTSRGIGYDDADRQVDASHLARNRLKTRREAPDLDFRSLSCLRKQVDIRKLRGELD